jgi:hypothetical protein
MMSVMNKVLHEYIPRVTIPFLDDVAIKGCAEGEKDGSLHQNGCRNFVVNNVKDCDVILLRPEQAHLTLSGAKSTFGQHEGLIMGHMCGWYGRKPSPAKINAI